MQRIKYGFYTLILRPDEHDTGRSVTMLLDATVSIEFKAKFKPAVFLSLYFYSVASFYCLLRQRFMFLELI